MEPNDIVAALQRVSGNEVKKYSGLVWYARCDRTDAALAINCARIEKAHPEETYELREGDDPQWAQGFNSGCLAMARLLNAGLNDPKEFAAALRNFPEINL